jgi:hypothetical protein
MNQAKYIGMDVHQATISVAVLDAPANSSWSRSSRPKPLPFCSSWKGSVEAYRSPWKRELRLLGCMTCSGLTSGKSWSAIRAGMPC